jgi:hypothetical protein
VVQALPYVCIAAEELDCVISTCVTAYTGAVVSRWAGRLLCTTQNRHRGKSTSVDYSDERLS